MATFEINTAVTNIGKQYTARSIVNDVAFHITNYSIGTAGSDASGYPLVPDLTLTTCPDSSIMPETSTFTSISYSSTFCVEFNIHLDTTEGNGTSSNLCLIGQITESSNPIEIGTYFLYAIGNYGDKTKTVTDVWDITAIVTF